MPVLIYNATPRPPVSRAIQWDGSDAAAAAIAKQRQYASWGSNPPPALRPMTVETDWSVSGGVLTITVTQTLNGQPPSTITQTLNPGDWLVDASVVDDFTFKRDYIADVAGQSAYEGH